MTVMLALHSRRDQVRRREVWSVARALASPSATRSVQIGYNSRRGVSAEKRVRRNSIYDKFSRTILYI